MIDDRTHVKSFCHNLADSIRQAYITVADYVRQYPRLVKIKQYIEDIEEDFNKVIHKKKLIKDDLKDSIEKMQIDSLNIKKEEETKKIELPEIKIKKETNEDIWKK